MVRIEPRYHQVMVGDSVEFRCLATGIPLPTIEWKREDGKQLPAGSSVEVRHAAPTRGPHREGQNRDPEADNGSTT